MERRKFFRIAPFGLAGIAALATNPLNAQEVTEPTGSTVMKAKQLTITGADGKQYHPLVVAAESTTYAEVPNQVHQPLFMPSERFRVTNDGSFTASKISFFSNGTENFSL